MSFRPNAFQTTNKSILSVGLVKLTCIGLRLHAPCTVTAFVCKVARTKCIELRLFSESEQKLWRGLCAIQRYLRVYNSRCHCQLRHFTILCIPLSVCSDLSLVFRLLIHFNLVLWSRTCMCPLDPGFYRSIHPSIQVSVSHRRLRSSLLV